MNALAIIWLVSTIICFIPWVHDAVGAIRFNGVTLRGILIFLVLAIGCVTPVVSTIAAFVLFCFFADTWVKPRFMAGWDKFWASSFWDKQLIKPRTNPSPVN